MNNIGEKYLPIGTVCILKEAKKRIMIIGFAAKGKETKDKLFDYIGCLYPEGVISSDKNLLFNHDQIDKVFSLGYVDEEQKQLMVKLKSYINETYNNDDSSESSSSNNIIKNDVLNNTNLASANMVNENNNQSNILQNNNINNNVNNNMNNNALPQMPILNQSNNGVNNETTSNNMSNANIDDIFNSVPNQ